MLSAFNEGHFVTTKMFQINLILEPNNADTWNLELLPPWGRAKFPDIYICKKLLSLHPSLTRTMVFLARANNRHITHYWLLPPSSLSVSRCSLSRCVASLSKINALLQRAVTESVSGAALASALPTHDFQSQSCLSLLSGNQLHVYGIILSVDHQESFFLSSMRAEKRLGTGSWFNCPRHQQSW